jgi:transcriptional regulator with XRE-family HTH domain
MYDKGAEEEGEAQTFGRHFRAIRARAGLTQARLAENAGVSVRAIIYWERDQHQPSLPELDAALRALRASPAERAELIERLTAPRAARLIAVAPASPQGQPGHAGALLKVLRRRLGANSAMVSAALGIGHATLHRWERLELRPSEEQIRLLCLALDAQPEELTALLTLPWKPVLRRPAPPPLAELQVRCALFSQDSLNGNDRLIDMDSLSLRSDLRDHAERSDEGRRLLAQVNADYGQWLMSQKRNTEARRSASLSLEIADSLGQHTLSAWTALYVLASVQLTVPRHGARKAFRLYERWLDAFTAPELRAEVLCGMADNASADGQPQKALALVDEADRLCAHQNGQPGDAIASADRSRRIQRTRIYRRLGRISEAVSFLPSPEVGSVSQKAFASLLWVDIMEAAGAKNDAILYLGVAQDAITTHGLHMWQTGADALGRRL